MTTQHFAWRTLASTEDREGSQCHAFDLDSPLGKGGVDRALCGYKKHTLELTPNSGTYTDCVCQKCLDGLLRKLDQRGA